YAEAQSDLDAARKVNGAGARVLSWEVGWLAPTLAARLVARMPDHTEAALDLYDEAIDVLEQVRASQPEETGRLRLAARTVHVYLEAALLALHLGQSERAYGYLLGAKAREVREALGRGATSALLQRLPAPERARLEAALAEQAALERAVRGPDWPDVAPGGGDAARGAPAPPRPPSRSDADGAALERARWRSRALVEQLARRFPDEVGLLSGRAATPREVRKALNDDEVLLDLLRH